LIVAGGGRRWGIPSENEGMGGAYSD